MMLNTAKYGRALLKGLLLFPLGLALAAAMPELARISHSPIVDWGELGRRK
jgi:hypothetical protein